MAAAVLDALVVYGTEISISYWSYSGQMHQPIFLQAEPGELYRRLWDTALEAYTRCVAVLRADGTSEDVLDAANVIDARGYTINDGFLHGFGIGLLAPSIGTRQARRGVPKPPFTFEAGMCVVVQPNVVTHDERAGVQLGNLFRDHQGRRRVPAPAAAAVLRDPVMSGDFCESAHYNSSFAFCVVKHGPEPAT